MIRTFFLVALAAAAAALWWFRDDAQRYAVARAPFLTPYLAATAPAGAATAPRAAGLPVVVATAVRRPIPITIDAVGTVQAKASIALKSRLDNQITSINVKEGALVKEGDLLLTLDGRAIKAQLAQVEATMVRDLAQIEQAKRDLARAEELLAKRITTEVQRDTAGTLLKVQQAQLAADQANRDNLAAQLTYTEIRSPISGRIGSIAMKIGTTVKAADTASIATVNQIDPIYVSFAVPQTLFGELRTAMDGGRVAITARVGQTATQGALAFVENTVDLATGTILAKAEMPNRDERLWPGAFVSVQATVGVEKDAISVPSAAVQIGQQGAYVFIIKDDRATLTNVTVSRTVGQDSILSAGLSGGEQIVVDGHLRLVNGALVQVQPARAREGVATGDTPGQTQRRG